MSPALVSMDFPKLCDTIGVILLSLLQPKWKLSKW